MTLQASLQLQLHLIHSVVASHRGGQGHSSSYMKPLASSLNLDGSFHFPALQKQALHAPLLQGKAQVLEAVRS